MRVNFNTYQGLSGLNGGDITDTIYDEIGGYTTFFSDGSQVYTDPGGGSVETFTPENAAVSAANAIAVANGGTITQSGSFVFPGMTPAQQNALIAKLGTAAGNWIAQKVGGSTIITRQGGGFGTMDIKGLLIPGAIVLGLFLLK